MKDNEVDLNISSLWHLQVEMNLELRRERDWNSS